MIARPLSRPHICLSCQRSLKRRSVPSRTHAVFQSTSSNPNEAAEPGENNKPTITIRRHAGAYRRHPTSRRNAHNGLSQYPLGRLYGHRGHKLRENREALNIDTLGNPAKVIVLRETKLNFYDSFDKIDDQKAQHVDIMSQLAKERGLVGQSEVEASINAFKPKAGEEPQGWDDLNEIVRVLQEGFTHAQLVKYLESFQMNSAVVEAATSTKKSLILGVTSWMPGVSGIVDSFDNDPLRGYSMQSHTSKQRLIMRILRECWLIELPEVADGIGQFEVQIRDGDLTLMSKGSSSPLALLHGQYLAHAEETLEVFPSRGTIRVTTMRHKKDIFLRILEGELNLIQRKTICLGDMYHGPPGQPRKGKRFETWLDQNFSNSVLQELSRLTHTEIVKISKDTLLVSSFEKNQESETSSRVDVVRRLLLASCNSVDRAKYSLECDGENDSPASFVPYPQIEGLNWTDSMRNWMRWTNPIPKVPETKDKQAGAEVHEVHDRSSTVRSYEDELDKPPPTRISNILPETSEAPTWWNTQPFTESSALFGNVLFSPSGSSHLSNPFDGANSFHTFSTLVPNLSRVLVKAQSSPVTNASIPSDAPITYLTLRFLPNPFQSSTYGLKTSKIGGYKVTRGIGSEILETFPPIEMRFAIMEDNKVTRLKEVQAIVDGSKADVMIPSNGVDIRWQERTTKRLRRYDRKVQGLQEFVRRSNLILHDGKLVTPPSVKLPIDEALCRGKGLSLLGGEDTDSKEVEYLFTGLDIRNTLVFNYFGWRLLYTSIEAGRAGGRRGELKLRPIFKGKVNTGEEFSNIVRKLALDLGGEVSELNQRDNSTLVVGSPVRRVRLDQKEPLVRNVARKWGLDEDGKKVGFWAKRVNLKAASVEGEDSENETLLGDGLWEREEVKENGEKPEVVESEGDGHDVDEHQNGDKGGAGNVAEDNFFRDEDIK